MTDLTDWDDDILSEAEADDGIIDLMDIVDKDPEDVSDDSFIELTDVVKEENIDLTVEADDDVIELTDVAEEDSIEGDLGIANQESPEFDEDLELDGGVSDDEGLDLESKDSSEIILAESVDSPVPFSDLNVDQAQIEAAFERVIEKKFADKIETILFAVMEKVIEKEITEIKENLQKDLDDIGKA